MVEQYIYSRAEKGATYGANNSVTLGYGFAGLSPQMTDELKAEARPHFGEYVGGSLRDANGKPPTIWRKVELKKSGKVLLQCCTPLYSTDETGRRHRMFHVSHGYIVDGGDADSPLQWLQLAYYTSDPNGESNGIWLQDAPSIQKLPEQYRTEFKLSNLYRVLGMMGVDSDCFLQIVLACFDALQENRRVLIAYDDTLPEKEELKKQILCWVYLCLPLALRRAVGADNEYTYKASPQFVQIAFVPYSRIIESQGTFSFQLDQVVPLEGDYLVYKGKIWHSKSYSSRWFNKETLFSRWLSLVVQALAQPSGSYEVLKELEATYRKFDEQLKAMGKPEQPDQMLYNTLCWMQLDRDDSGVMREINRQMQVTEEEELNCQMTLLREIPSADALNRLLERVLERHTVPAREADLELLVQALQTEQRERALHILGAFLSAEADAPGADLSAVFQRYQLLLRGEDDAFAELLKLFSLGDSAYALDWRKIGADPTAAKAGERRVSWGEKYLDGCLHLDQLPDMAEKVAQQLPHPAGSTQEDLAREILMIVRRWFDRKYPEPTLQDIADLAMGAQKHFHEEDGWVYIKMLKMLADRYTAHPETASLENLELMQKAFRPLQSSETAGQCWQALCEQEMEALQHSGASYPAAETLPRWRELVENSPLKNNGEAAAVLEQLYEQLLQEPQPVMTTSWLDSQLGGTDHSSGLARQALVLLNTFAKHSSYTVKAWSDQQKNALPEVQEKARKALPRFFAAGLLPGVNDALLSYILHLNLDEMDPVLVQASRQGGTKLLQNMLAITRRYVRYCKAYGKTDLQLLMEAISGNDQVLDALYEQTGEKNEFALRLAENAVKMQKNGHVTREGAETVLDNVRDYCSRRGYRKLCSKIEKCAR